MKAARCLLALACLLLVTQGARLSSMSRGPISSFDGVSLQKEQEAENEEAQYSYDNPQSSIEQQPQPSHPRFAGWSLKGMAKAAWGAAKKVGGALVKGAKAALNLVTQLPPLPTPPPPEKNPFHFRKQDIEDCVACQYVWYQVEMEIGNDQIEENVYDAFAQICIDAQKAPIFYPACEHMFDDIYSMIGDYTDGRLNVNQLCIGAGFCRDPFPPDEKPPPPQAAPKFPVPLPKPPVKLPAPPKPPPPPPKPKPNMQEQLCKQKIAAFEGSLSKFLVEIHFENGYEKYRLFDYSSPSGKKTFLNAGGFKEEQKNFPKKFMPLHAKYKAIEKLGCTPPRLDFYLAGFASIAGERTKNMILSENRARAVACYLNLFLSKLDYRDYVFRIGFYGEERSRGKSPADQAKDRRVSIFFKLHKLKKEFRSRQGGKTAALTWQANSPNMDSYCSSNNRRLWQNQKFLDEWLKLRK